MKRQTLQFASLQSLCAFQKQHLTEGYLINTLTLTLTAKMPGHLLLLALAQYGAQEIRPVDYLSVSNCTV